MYRMFHMQLAERAPRRLCDWRELRKNVCLKSYRIWPRRIEDKVTRRELIEIAEVRLYGCFDTC